MNFGNLKASFARRSNRNRRSPCDCVLDVTANGVVDNKDEISFDVGQLDVDQRQRSVMLKSSKHKPKTDKTGIWKTLRLKLGRNRQCWDGNESPSPSEDSDSGFTPGSRRHKQTYKSKSASVCPIPSPFHVARTTTVGNSELTNGVEAASDVYYEQTLEMTPRVGFNVDTKSDSRSRDHAEGLKWIRDEKSESSDNNYSGSISCSNNVIKINFDDYHSVPNHEIRSLTRELFKLSKYGWYWGPITRTEAEEKLSDQPDGAFLVRDSSDDRHLLSLSFRSYGKTLHTRIEHCNGLFSFYAQPEPEGHASIVDLIDDSMNYSQSGVFCYSRARSPGSLSFPVRLTKPVSRFTQVRSLQYLCRFVIRQYTRFDHIQKLPLPSRIRGYIEAGHY